jgi:hypothetical protein
MKPQHAFEICCERYRGMRAFLNGSVRAVDLETPSSGYQWRPDRAGAADYVADFQLAGARALRRPEWKGRLQLFQNHFCGGVEYRRAIEMLGVSSGTFDWWAQEVKKAAGKEFLRSGLFPPRGYFRAGGKPRTAPDSRAPTF